MFWSTKAVEQTSLDKLLACDTVTLEAVAEDPYALQELRNTNDKLLQFLTKPDIVEQLVRSALYPQIDESKPLQLQYTFAHQCCELLSLNSSRLSEAVIGNDAAMRLIADFLTTAGKQNALIASFNMKIICQLFSHDADKVLEILSQHDFVRRCVGAMQYAAVAEMLYRLSNITSYEVAIKMREWMFEGGLVEGLIELFDVSLPSACQDMASYLWSELVKNLREILYSNDDKTADALLKGLQERPSVEALLDKMLKQEYNASVVTNVAAVLTTLLETNFVLHAPSRLLHEDKENLWMGGAPDESNTQEDANIWQPDPERTTELAVAERSADILRIVVKSLEAADDESWWALMQLLVCLVNTGHYPTHKALFQGFQDVPLSRLFELVEKRPAVSAYHKQVHKLVTYVLFTSGTEPTPLAEYIIKESKLVDILWAGIQPRTDLATVPKLCLRSFHLHLAIALDHARLNSPIAPHISELLKETGAEKADSNWSKLLDVAHEFEEANRSDVVLEGSASNSGPSSSRELVKGMAVDDEAAELASTAQKTLTDYEQRNPTLLLPEEFDQALGSLSLHSDSDFVIDPKAFNVDLTAQFRNSEGDEAKFEALCSMKQIPKELTASGEGAGWPAEEECAKEDDWPSGPEKTTNSSSNTSTFPINWQDANKAIELMDDDWPTSENSGRSRGVMPMSPPRTSTEKAEGDAWANFSSPKPANLTSLKSNSDSNAVNWDNAFGGEPRGTVEAMDDWPTTTENNPVLAGIASNVLAPPTSSDC